MSQGFTKKTANFAGNGIRDILQNGIMWESTSGSSHDYTIPAGVKRVTISFHNVSTSVAGSAIGCRLGDSTGVYATTYFNKQWRMADGNNGTAGSNIASIGTQFSIRPTSAALAANSFFGHMELTLIDEATNQWVMSAFMLDGSAALEVVGAGGSLAMTNELTTIRIFTAGGVFDSGLVNIQYDNPDPLMLGSVANGSVLQVVHSELSTNVTGTTALAFADTIPTSTQGDEFITVSITPQSAYSKLMVEFHGAMSVTVAVGNGMTAALFRDSDSAAIAGDIGINPQGSGYSYPFHIRHIVNSNDTVSTTFRIRAGTTSGTNTMGGYASTDKLGGIPVGCTLTVTEIAA